MSPAWQADSPLLSHRKSPFLVNFLSQIVLSYSVMKHGWHTSALLIFSPEFTVTRDTTVVRDHLPPPHLLLSLSG